MSYLQAFVIALVQGVTELFPVSSLGHSVLVPAWIGGSWQTMVTQSSQASSETSFYLAYIVALHCATALALLWFFRADWARITRGLARPLPFAGRARGYALWSALAGGLAALVVAAGSVQRWQGALLAKSTPPRCPRPGVRLLAGRQLQPASYSR